MCSATMQTYNDLYAKQFKETGVTYEDETWSSVGCVHDIFPRQKKLTPHTKSMTTLAAITARRYVFKHNDEWTQRVAFVNVKI